MLSKFLLEEKVGIVPFIDWASTGICFSIETAEKLIPPNITMILTMIKTEFLITVGFKVTYYIEAQIGNILEIIKVAILTGTLTVILSVA
jgi:hypothetical protein